MVAPLCPESLSTDTSARCNVGDTPIFHSWPLLTCSGSTVFALQTGPQALAASPASHLQLFSSSTAHTGTAPHCPTTNEHRPPASTGLPQLARDGVE